MDTCYEKVFHGKSANFTAVEGKNSVEHRSTDQILPVLPTWSSVSDDFLAALFHVLRSRCNSISICRLEPAIQKVCELIRAVKFRHFRQLRNWMFLTSYKKSTMKCHYDTEFLQVSHNSDSECRFIKHYYMIYEMQWNSPLNLWSLQKLEGLRWLDELRKQLHSSMPSMEWRGCIVKRWRHENITCVDWYWLFDSVSPIPLKYGKTFVTI